MVSEQDSCRALKQQIRQQALARRQALEGKDALSRRILARLAALPEYAGARTVMFYVHLRSEVQTRPFLPGALEAGKQIVVPYCTRGRIELFLLKSLDELAPGALRVPEPKPELRAQSDRQVDVSKLDLVVVPGLAFDRRGGRIGHGAGYYDALLPRIRPDAPRVALAFECQLIDRVPMLAHDVYMHKVITERAVYECAPPR
jgi:5-formyltetrahydrofolate cyclo-ligase